jgi:hypothetical protein
MNSALISIPVVKKNRVKYEKTLLVNNNKVKNFKPDASDTNYTLLYYDQKADRRESRTEFKVAKTLAQVDALVREEANETVIPLYVNTRRQGRFGIKTTVNRVEYISVDSWVWAYDNSDGTTCTVWLDEGAFRLLELNVNHTISQISSRASTSASFSESGI